jgi:chromosome segregation ATPase
MRALWAQVSRRVFGNLRVDEAKARIATAEKALAVKETQYNAQASEVGRLRGDLTRLEAQNNSLQAKLDEAIAKKAAAAGTESQELIAKEKIIGELNTKVAGLEGKVAREEADGKQWKARYDESQKAVADKNIEVKASESKLADAKSQRDSAVNAWNEFLGYLYEKDKWGEIKVTTDLVKQKLRNLESKTSRVDGMKSVLQ